MNYNFRFHSLKDLPSQLTNYYILKSIAVILMIFDHAGAYFFPEQEWMRLIGRLCVPIWFFFIGYARSRNLGPEIWLGAILLEVGDVIAGLSIFPLNILFTIIIARLIIDPLMYVAMRGEIFFWLICAAFFMLSGVSYIFFDYGTIGFMMVMFGWLCRHRYQLPQTEKYPATMFLVAGSIFILRQIYGFKLGLAETSFLTAGVFGIMGYLYFFKPVVYAPVSGFFAKAGAGMLKITGRRTLEIYVLHFLLFKAIGVVFFPERFKLFQWMWILPS